MSRVFRIVVIVVALLVPALQSVRAQEPEKIFQAGVAKVNITPWLGLSIVGYMNDRKVEAIHDEIHVRCLVLDDGANALAIAVVDSCAVTRKIMDDAKARAHGTSSVGLASGPRH